MHASIPEFSVGIKILGSYLVLIACGVVVFFLFRLWKRYFLQPDKQNQPYAKRLSGRFAVNQKKQGTNQALRKPKNARAPKR